MGRIRRVALSHAALRRRMGLVAHTRGLSVREACRQAGVDRQALYRAMKGRWRVPLHRVAPLLDAWGVPLAVFEASSEAALASYLRGLTQQEPGCVGTPT